MIIVKKFNTYSFSIYLLLFLILLIFPSVFAILFDGTSKRIGIYPGILLLLVLFTILNNYRIKRKVLAIKYFFIFSIIIHLILSYILSRTDFFLRSFYSFILILIIIISAFTFANICNNIRNKIIENTLFYSFIILNIDLIFSLLFKINHLDKSFFLFPEPSHFALIYIPILFFNIFRFSIFKFSFFSFIVFMVAIHIKSLVLLFGLSIIVFLYLFRNKHYTSLILFFCLSIITISTNQYFYDRLNVVDTENLSLLVFLCGWERAYLSLLNTNGLGVGLNQLGFTNNAGFFRDVLIKLNAPTLNIYDGGSTAPKIISELGLVGLFIIVFYLKISAQALKKILYVQFLSPRLLLYSSFVFSSLLDLFIRGTGYFSVNMILFFTVCFMTHKNSLD